MKRILLAGVAVADFVFNVEKMPSKAEKYRAREAFVIGGGNAANAAVSVERLGGEAILAARVGTDMIGDFIIADLEREGVNTSVVHRIEGGCSSFSSIYVDIHGERQIMNYRGRDLGMTADWLNDVSHFDALLADNRWPPLTRKAIEIAKARDIPIVIDAEPPFDSEVVQHATHVAFSYRGLLEYTGMEKIESALVAATEMLDTWVCVTNGENGTYFIENGITKNIPAVRVETIDTLGAGDVWHAAFTLMLAEGASLRCAINFANAAGTLKCMRPKGRNGAPTRADVEEFLKLHKSMS